eukprot:9241232-Pyramimonas_sp.AAC.1
MRAFDGDVGQHSPFFSTTSTRRPVPWGGRKEKHHWRVHPAQFLQGASTALRPSAVVLRKCPSRHPWSWSAALAAASRNFVVSGKDKRACSVHPFLGRPGRPRLAGGAPAP